MKADARLQRARERLHPPAVAVTVQISRALFLAASFVSAALLFLVEPIVAKGILPVLGGGAVVWTTCAAFFQVALVGGYLYGHLLSRRRRLRAAAAVHVLLLVAATVLFHRGARGAWMAPARHEALWLFARLATTVGPCFVLLAATAPLILRWFTAAAGAQAREPYFLYAASNAGSLMALLAYPVLLEPWTGLRAQRQVWLALVLVDSLLLAVCAWQARGATPARDAPAAPGAPVVSWRARGRWMLLAAVPSSLLLSVTSYMTTDLVALPLLWVLPLALYLLTFVAAFSVKRRISTTRLLWIQGLLVVPVAAEMAVTRQGSALLLIPLHGALFLVSALVCHRRLADSRPPPEQASGFYLCLALGGAAGALFNVFLAPALFRSMAEYPLGLVAAILLRPAPPADSPNDSSGSGRARWTDLALPAALAVGLALAFSALRRLSASASPQAQLVALGLILAGAGAAIYAFRFRPVRFGLGLGLMIGCGALLGVGSPPVVAARRSFYAVHRVTREGSILKLASGNTLHGAQDTAPGRSREPLTYYHRRSPIADVLSASAGSPLVRRVGVVGLGAGALAAYAEPGAHWTFFEIDPVVASLSEDDGLFTYLRDAGRSARVDVVLGDGRLTLAAQPDGSFGLLVLDAFSSDAVPVHLLTLEALSLYLRKLAPDGLLAFHVSNRYVALDRVIAGAAGTLGLAALERAGEVSAQEGQEGKSGSVWVVVGRSPGALGRIAARPGWRPIGGAVRAWTDDASSLAPVLRLDGD